MKQSKTSCLIVLSSRPYLLRAIYEWLVDSNCTPHLVVDVSVEGVIVPLQYVSEGQIVLNVSPIAVSGLVMSNADVRFSARFAGKPMDIFVPVRSIKGIYAKENGQGMVFEDIDEDCDPPTGPADKQDKKPALKLVK